MNIFEGGRRLSKLIAALWVVGPLLATTFVAEPNISATYLVSSDNPPGISDPSCTYNEKDYFREHRTYTTKNGTQARLTVCFSKKTRDFMVASPDGDTFLVTAPEVAPEQEVLTYVQSRPFSSTSLTGWVLKRGLGSSASEEEEFRARYEYEKARYSATNPSSKGRPAWKNAPIVIVWDVPTYGAQATSQLVLSQKDEEWIDSQWWSERGTQYLLSALVILGGLVLLWVVTWAVGWIARGFLDIPEGSDRKLTQGPGV